MQIVHNRVKKAGQIGEALGAAGVFSMFGFRSKKYAGHIFRAESEADFTSQRAV
jgi:hypothetical protein